MGSADRLYWRVCAADVISACQHHECLDDLFTVMEYIESYRVWRSRVITRDCAFIIDHSRMAKSFKYRGRTPGISRMHLLISV